MFSSVMVVLFLIKNIVKFSNLLK